MCGIAGIFRYDSDATREDRARVGAMVAALHHRGPNEGNVSVHGRATLGHTRLSILDLTSAARQPMRGRHVSLSYNGELYDYRELRTTLSARGVHVQSTGDTEVLLRLLELEWSDALDRLKGLFAFAAYDEARGELLLARDPLGKKPLFFARQKGCVVFASELAALAAGGVAIIPDASRFPEFVVRGYVVAPTTLCRGVEQLRPGEVVTVRGDGALQRRLYSQLPWLSETPPHRVSSVEEAVVGVRSRFEAAVQKRMVADVPVGAFLSGGFDSAAVVAVAQKAVGPTLQSFAIGFEGAAEFDETREAAASAKLLGTTHRTRVLDVDALATLEELTRKTGEPQGDSSAVPTFAVSALAAENVRVVLTGDGGDELFAGYDRFVLAYLAELVPSRAGALMGASLRRVGEGSRTPNWLRRARRLARASRLGPAATLVEWAGGTQIDFVERLTQNAIDVAALAAPEEEAIETARRHGAPLLHALLTANMATYLPGDVLVKVDRASMAHSIEARSPFLDEDLVSYAAGLAPLLLARGPSLKWIVKRALSPLVPTEIRRRRKRGFGAPVGHWFRGRGSELAARLVSSSTRIRAHFDGKSLAALLAAHARGEEEVGILLWRLLALEEWLAWTSRASAEEAANVALC